MDIAYNNIGQDIKLPARDFALEHGGVLKNDRICARIYGQKDAPVIVIPGGISASRFIADGQDGKNGSGGWWKEIVKTGGAIDLSQFQVLGFDVAPGPQNSNKRHTITTNDQAKRLAHLLDFLGLKTVHAIIGMSYGGMIGMSFAALYPQRLAKLCVFGAAHRPWPFAVGLRGIGRRIIEQCQEMGDAKAGLKLARQLAMTTYRSPEEFVQRFSAKPNKLNPAKFDVGDYLEHCGNKYPDIMPVNRYLTLSESIDLHHIDASKISVPTRLIAVSNDQLAPPSEMQSFANNISGQVRLDIIDSIYGHDSFLKSTELLAPILADFCDRKSHAA